MNTSLLRFITGLCVVISLAMVSAAETVPPVTLTVTTPAPNSPGVQWIKATVRWQDKEFPVAFGVYLPKEYFVLKDEKFPVICTLHNGPGNVGGSDGGEMMVSEGFGLLTVKDIGADNRHGGEWPPVKFNPRKDAKFITVIPQTPKDKGFDGLPMSGVVVEELNWVEKHYRTDPDRYFLTGFSYGGSCTWHVGTQYPERFAAIVPLSGRRGPDTSPEILKDVGVWCGVGEQDTDIRAACTYMKDLFEKAKHPNFHFTLVKNGNHHCYQSIYGDPEFWKWLLAQKRKPKNESTKTADATTAK